MEAVKKTQNGASYSSHRAYEDVEEVRDSKPRVESWPEPPTPTKSAATFPQEKSPPPSRAPPRVLPRPVIERRTSEDMFVWRSGWRVLVGSLMLMPVALTGTTVREAETLFAKFKMSKQFLIRYENRFWYFLGFQVVRFVAKLPLGLSNVRFIFWTTASCRRE